MKRLFSWAILLCCMVAVHAQELLTERVALLPSTSSVARGSYVDIQGQVLSTNHADFFPYSRYLYLELIDGNNEVKKRQKIRLNDDGSFNTSMLIGQKLKNGLYFLRGFTQFMQNRPTGYFPTQPLYVGTRPSTKAESSALQAFFFPEGGSLCNGVSQQLGIFLCDSQGNPVQHEFTVIRNDGDTLTVSETSRSGFSTIVVTPKKGENHVLRTMQNGQSESFPLPESSDTTTLSAFIRKGRVYCQILSSQPRNDLSLYVHHQDFGLKQLPLNNGVGVGDISGCSPGMLTAWLADEEKQVVAQRSLFVPFPDDSLSIQTETTCLAGAVPHVAVGDTLPGTRMFLRIVPLQEQDVSHAFETLCLESELCSEVPFPKHFYEEDEPQQRKDLECWLLSARQALVSPEILSDSLVYPYAIEKSLSLSGKISKSNEKPLSGGTLQLYNASNGDASLVETDSLGNFTTYINDFEDGMKIYLQGVSEKKKSDKYIYDIEEPLFSEKQNLSPYKMLNGQTSMQQVVSSIDTLKTYQLEGVTVKARKTPLDLAHTLHRSRMNFLNYLGRADIERLNLVTIEDVVRRLEKVYIAMGRVGGMMGSKNNPPEKLVLWRNGIRNALLDISAHGGQLDFVVDGLLIDHGFESVLCQSTVGVESVEVVYANDSRCVVNRAPAGYIEIRHRLSMKSEELPSNGVCVQPLGLTYTPEQPKTTAPIKPGRYKLLIDLISPDRTIRSYERKLEVKP